MKKGRVQEDAVLRTLANKKSLNFATRRILKDLEEIEKETLPNVGVFARPLPNTLFTWHANILGPAKSAYEGGVFHIIIDIPSTYPHQPPRLSLSTPLTHPNVFNQSICLSMLEKFRDISKEGWTSAYTIQSVLMQLQTFLLEEPKVDVKFQKDRIKLEVEGANNYKCNTCTHGGKLSAWPQTKKIDVEQEKDKFQLLDFEETENFGKQILCYHTKLSYKNTVDEYNQDIKGVPLGLGLSITKVPRTGLIQNAIASLDYLSLKAYIKEGIRWSSNNEKLTHLLPLYFGETDNKERALKMGRNSLGFIMANNTKRFKPEYILEVYSKILVTSIMLISTQKRHYSVAIIRQIANVHANFLLFLNEYPELYDIIEAKLQEFIKDETRRTKDYVPNLAQMLAYLLVAPKTQFKDVFNAYHSESLDRQVFWILKSVPELVDPRNNESLSNERANLTFRCQKTSYQIFCLFKQLIVDIRYKGKDLVSPQNIYDAYVKNYCKLPDSVETKIQTGFTYIVNEINDFDGFYSFMDQPIKSLSEINKSLKAAIQNSKAKLYHGDMEDVHTLPTSKEQMVSYLNKMPKLEDFYNFRTIEAQEGDKRVHKIQVQVKREGTENEWKKVCEQRWSWIRDCLAHEKQLSATQLAKRSMDVYKFGDLDNKPANNRVQNLIKDKWINQGLEMEKPEVSLPEHSWQQLFMKLDLQDLLLYFDQNPDFQRLYERLQLYSQHITSLTLPITSVSNIKSGYYYIMKTLESLVKLEYLEIAGVQDLQQNLSLKQVKSIYKGLNNFIQEGGNLRGISLRSFNVVNKTEISDKIFGCLAQMPKLMSIQITSTNILELENASKSLGNIVTNLKDLRYLVLTDNSLPTPKAAKEIADGLMRAKNLRIVDISNNQRMGFEGLQSIIYNLAFASNLQLLDIHNCTCTTGNVVSVIEALYKLLKINTSLEYLDCSYISDLNPKLNEEFFTHLGEIKSLRILDLSHSGKISGIITNLGKSIAMNAKMGGSLEFVNFNGTFDSNYTLKQFYNFLKVSDYDKEIWYGDKNKANKMKGNDLKKHYYNNLKTLHLKNCYSLKSSFDLKTFEKHNQSDNEQIRLFARSSKLENIYMPKCGLDKSDADLLKLALDPTREGFLSKIKVLDLQGNNLGKEGMKIFAKIFEINNILEVVDLSANKIGVRGGQEIANALAKNTSVKFLNIFNNKIGYDGACAFSKCLSTNSTLEFIEMGHNRIRNKGLLSIADGISANENSRLQSLGLRFNFLTYDGMSDFIKTIKGSHIRQLFIKNNSIQEYGLFELKRVYDNLGIDIEIDIFEKLKYLDDEKLKRTVYIHPMISRQSIKNFFEQTHHCGIITDIRVRRGPKWPIPRYTDNIFTLVEFADEMSTTRALAVASRKLAMIDGKKFRIYKAGTGTFVYQKKTSKQKKAETSKTNILSIVPETQTLFKRPVRSVRRNVGAGTGDRVGRGGRGGRGFRGGRGGRERQNRQNR